MKRKQLAIVYFLIIFCFFMACTPKLANAKDAKTEATVTFTTGEEEPPALLPNTKPTSKPQKLPMTGENRLKFGIIIGTLIVVISTIWILKKHRLIFNKK
ncbi:LPXTG cell wall anchor domain-containing protein [Enterococcus rivorum]|uniref:Gram-positive cocci surface proteins LPxTG domain-containing protein n=1 Tax=Enterococcus rivorum TaxID=762845 RepID=A0A1E5KXB8_9ENTE|nr:LPXTG cell wall anchor domain-containing protein [Enterococcus rivorum]MBP2097345.1 LPXTG-motif cell wall-anchored protein [Enterococcus rivorum]OEH82309.1 hypothetical protein BCR26_02430 [Enterococcus rivorum]